MALYDIIKEQVDSIIKEYREISADGTFTVAEVWKMSQDAAASFVKIAEAYEATGADKKAAVMEAAAKFYDEIVAPIDIKQIPNVVEPIFDKFARVLFLELISGAIDSLVTVSKATFTKG